MPQANTSPLARALRDARRPHHTDADVDAVLRAFAGHTAPPPDGGASTLLDVSAELRGEGTQPTLGALGARITERAVARGGAR